MVRGWFHGGVRIKGQGARGKRIVWRAVDDSQALRDAFPQLGQRVDIRIKGTSKNPHFIPTAALLKKFLAYIYNICGAAKFLPRLAFGRTLNF